MELVMPTRVLLADDNALFRDGIAQILRSDGRFDVVGQTSRGDETIAAAARLRPDLILIDLDMPGMSGVDAIKSIRAADDAVPIGVLTMFETQDYVQAALNAGASGYLAKDSTPADLCGTAAALAQGKRDLVAIPLPPSGAGTLGSKLARLTAREVEVLRALASGSSNEAIARSLGISPKTLRNHISNTYHKLGIYDRAQAVLVAVREGLVDVDGRR
jgi:two-component system, NarL family, response regulator DegU